MIHSVSNMHLYEWNIQECNVNLCFKILLVWKVSLATKDLRTNDVEFGGGEVYLLKDLVMLITEECTN